MILFGKLLIDPRLEPLLKCAACKKQQANISHELPTGIIDMPGVRAHMYICDACEAVRLANKAAKEQTRQANKAAKEQQKGTINE